MMATCIAALSEIIMAKKDEVVITNPTGIRTDTETTPLSYTSDDYGDTQKKAKKVNEYTRIMRFDADNSFRVVQLSDLWNDGDSKNFGDTITFVERLLKKEQPDLVVVTGDVVAPDQDTHYQLFWESIMAPIVSSKTPYVATGGRQLKNVSRAETLSIDRNYGGDLSWSGY